MLLSGNSNKVLSKAVEKGLTGSLDHVGKTVFPDGEISLSLQNLVSQDKVCLLQSTSPPLTENVFELLMTLEALKQQGVQHISLIMSYFGYARQDQQDTSGAIPLKSIARLIEAAGASDIVVLDPHWHATKNPFTIPCTTLHSTPLMALDITNQGPLEDLLLVAPDQGSLPRIHPLATLLGLDILPLEKQRDRQSVPHLNAPQQDITGKKCLIIDDIVDSGKTLCEAARVLDAQGAKEISAYVTHGILSPGSHQRLQDSPLKKLVITDSVQATPQTLNHPKTHHISVAPLILDFLKDGQTYKTEDQHEITNPGF